MKLCSWLIVGMVLVAKAQAGEVGFRYNGTVQSSGVFDLDPKNGGKLAEITYKIAPLENFFVEGAFGRYFTEDFDSHGMLVGEIAPGVQVQAGPVRVRLSHGLTIFNQTSNYIQFGTHFGIDLVSKAGVSVGLERTHYSNGTSGANGGGYNMTGFILGFHF